MRTAIDVSFVRGCLYQLLRIFALNPLAKVLTKIIDRISLIGFVPVLVFLMTGKAV